MKARSGPTGAKARAIVTCAVLLTASARAQVGTALTVDTTNGLSVSGFIASSGTEHRFAQILPLFSVEVNDTILSSSNARIRSDGDSLHWDLGGRIEGWFRVASAASGDWTASLTIENPSGAKTRVGNVVPLGESPERAFIKSWGPSDYNHRLSRSHLFIPGRGPVGVVLPDDAWEMGFCDAPAGDGQSLAAVARRTGSANAEERRFFTILQPGGSVQYSLHAAQHAGDWHDGLRLVFRDRWIYDRASFDNSLFDRSDLQWIRHSYLLLLQFAWDREYYDALAHRSGFDAFLGKYDHLIGVWDAHMIWPTWPRLGLDPRNQWDMYRDLPGGLPELRRQAHFAQSRGTRYFISYNPWDESTRMEDHLAGLTRMLRAIDADGVVLDTWGESSRAFQAAADSVKPGVILYSEGMAVPKDMPGIVAGRVHDAISLPPPLNLNKLIKPEFAIFRVIQLAEGRIHREVAISLFNGYGCELNIMRPGRPDWIDQELAYLGKSTQILRANSSAFLSREWTPLIPTRADSIWVNRWPTPAKTIYTVYSLRPEGWNGPLFEVPADSERHYVSLWNHRELQPTPIDGRIWISATTDGFNRAWLDTRREGGVDCIAALPRTLSVRRMLDSLEIGASAGTKIVVWAGNPSYHTPHKEYPIGARTIPLLQAVGTFDGTVVVQAFDGTELLDERDIELPLAIPRLLTPPERTTPAAIAPPGMVEIPAGTFVYRPSRNFLSPNETVPYPGDSTSRRITFTRFFMDRYPVTNRQFAEFLRFTRYRPADTTNFLRHWIAGKPPNGEEDHPVVWVSRDDARAYAKWAGKRLPTEPEWQYAAQGTDGRKYPWGNSFDSTRCNASAGHTTAVAAFPSGASPFGVMDLVGNVWQLMNDLYTNGTFIFGMLRGGCYFHPTSSWWYVQGGPQPVDNPQILLMVAPGFDRAATVGFRCAKDAK